MNWPDITCSLNPTWPDWLPETAAVPALLGTGAVLAVLTLWTYLGVRGRRIGRVLAVLLLRMAAVAVALLVALRPSVGVQVLEGLEPSKLLIVVDASESMNVPDDFNSQSRWDNARRILASRAVTDALKRLSADEQIEAVSYQAAEGVAPFDPRGKALGKRTDMGAWLHELYQKHAGQDKLRAVLLFSDGADNGTRYPTLDEARKWRGVCPIHAFGHGKPQEEVERKDIIVETVRTAPTVPAKTKMAVTAMVHAPGFEGVVVKVGLWAQGPQDPEPVLLGEVEKHTLKSAKNNEIVLTREAPETPDEYKLTFKVEKVDGEADHTNNEASTFVVVTKEGLSVLWVEGRQRPYEPVFALRYALGGDKRFRVYYAQADPKAPGRDRYEFDKRQYDVIVIGDLSAPQFSGGDVTVLERVRDLVKAKKAGLMMLGGVDTFGRGGWDRTPLAEVLPVTLDIDQQLDNPVRVRPTEEALKGRYPFLTLDQDGKKNQELWENEFAPLDGMAFLGKVKDGAVVLAKGNGDDPILVAGQPAGRVLVFGGDTTWKAWRRPQTLAAYNKFWRQAMLWLANQDDRAGELWVKLESRRLLAGTSDKLAFTFGLEKDREPVTGATYTVQARGPGGTFNPLFRAEQKHQRGELAVPPVVGEYLLQIRGKGKDRLGSEVSDEKTVHFLVVAEDLELARKAPDHDHLTSIAVASGGQFYPADETLLLKLLSDLKGQVRQESHARVIRWPDWDRRPVSDAWTDQLAGLWGSAAPLWFIAFAALLGCEWGLRRLWGMV
jgi:uncharacterized membrane protein